jgi:hypothetical protein
LSIISTASSSNICINSMRPSGVRVRYC